MERYIIPRDFDSRSMGVLALRLAIDEMYANSDSIVHNILNKIKTETETP